MITVFTRSKWTAPHVIPVDDSVRHELSLSCICHPEVGRIPLPAGGMNFVYFHNSLDQRERADHEWDMVR